MKLLLVPFSTMHLPYLNNDSTCTGSQTDTIRKRTLAVSRPSPIYKVRIQFWKERKQAGIRQLPKPCRLYREIQMLEISKQKLYFNPQLYSRWTQASLSKHTRLRVLCLTHVFIHPTPYIQ